MNLRPWELLLILLVIALVAGVIALIVIIIRLATKSSAQATSQSDTPRPPGWYPVPDGSGRVAWWNGDAWDDSVTPPDQK